MSLPILPQDKANHVIYGATAAAAGLMLAAPAGSMLLAAAAAQLAAAVFGVGKEVYDASHRETHTADWRDALATALGGALVSAPCLVGAFFFGR